jgi:hypothetical protein
MSVKDDGVPDEHSAWSTFLFFVEMRYSIFEACVIHCHLAQITEYLEKEFWPLLGIAALCRFCGKSLAVCCEQSYI